MLSATILQALEARAVAAPPPGFSTAFVRYYFRSERASLLTLLRPLDALAEEREADQSPQDLEKGKARTEANLAAMTLVAEAKRQGRALTEDERHVVRAYSGWGGLSIEKNLARMPDGFKAQAQGLIHEFYTPTALAEEIARVLRPLLPGLETSGVVRALEPSAGIGRNVHALTAPQVRWQAVELSPVSSQLLEATVPPGTQVFAGSFEEYVATHPEVDGQVDLVVSNPPYGFRGGTAAKDRPFLKQDRAYFYFLERALGLLRAGGLGVFLVPYGFLTGRAKEYRDFRAQLLSRQHLAAAFRLPSDLFPGAQLVTDLLFFRARGGTLRTPSPADAEVLDGRYYQLHPDHILGVEVRTDEDDGDKSAVQRFEEQLANPTGKRPRFGYEVMRRRTVAGELLPLRLPDVLPERPLCFECPIIPAERSSAPVVLLTAEIEAAARLGRRIAALSALLARGDDASKADAEALHRELLPSLDGFTGHYGSPWARKDLVAATSSPKVGDAVLTFLNAFDKGTGDLVPSVRTLPPFTPRFRGAAMDIDGQARWLYAQTGTVTADSLLSFHRQAGGTLGADALLRALLDEEWAWDRGELFPPEVYYSGYLWPKLDRARSYPDNPDYERQVGKLLDAIKPATFDQIFLSLRSTWVPIEIVRDFVVALFRQPMPPLERVGDQITLPGVDPIVLSLGEMDTYQAKGGARYELTQDLLTFLGYMNNDLQLFRPPVGDGKKLDDARAEFALAVNKQWSKFLDDRAGLRAKLTELYNRLYRGYVAPSYAREPLNLARWGKTIKLNPWQDEAAQALTAKRRGLLCFTVGVGKTFTGCAIIAKARQAGWSVRPVVVVPNNLLWNWYLSFGLALPDYSVGIIGAERYVGKDGKARERTDTPQERAAKWQAFQRGEYDVMLVTYSMLRRSKLSNNMDLTVAELVALDENLQAQLRDQGKSRLKNQVRQEQSRDKLLLARATLLRDLAA